MSRISTITTLFLVITLLLITSTALAQGGDEYDLSWSTINAGGTSNGGEFGLTGAIGQSDAGTLSGGEFTLNSGFILEEDEAGGGSGGKIYLPIVLK